MTVIVSGRLSNELALAQHKYCLSGRGLRTVIHSQFVTDGHARPPWPAAVGGGEKGERMYIE